VRLAVFPDFDGVLGRRSERLRIHVRSCAPDGTAAPPVVVPVDARKAKPFPFAVPTHVRAKRHGRKIAVTWRTRVTATHTSFDVAALAGGDFLDFQDVDGSGRRRYRATLTVPAHARVTRVTVYAYDARDDLSREVSARVR
jgi:hypothetical protein